MADWELALLMGLLGFCLGDGEPRKPDLITWLAPLGGFLAFLSPGYPNPIRAEVLQAVVIPLVIWILFQDWVFAPWRPSWKEALGWLFCVIGSGQILGLVGVSAWPSALACGAVLASLVWRIIPKRQDRSLLTNFGPLLLIFLITESDSAMLTPRSYLGGLFSGAFFGLLLAGLTAVLTARKPAQFRGWAAFTQVLLTYWFALFVEVSAVSAALVSVAFYAELKLLQDISPESVTGVLPPGSRWPRLLIFLLLLLLGWQAHLPLVGGVFFFSGIILAAFLALSLAGGKLGIIPRLKLPGIILARSGLFLATGVPLVTGFLQTNTASIPAATALAAMVSLLAPALLASVRTYRAQIIVSAEGFERWEKINSPTWSTRSSEEDLEE